MKRKFLASLGVIALLSSCNKAKYLADVDLNVDLPYSKQFSTPAVDPNSFPKNGMAISFPAQSYETNSADVLASHSLTAHKIDRVDLKSFTNKISKSQDFDFVDSIKIYLSADDLPEILIASQNSIPNDSKSLTFECTDINLKEYFLKNKVYIRMLGYLNAPPKATTYTNNFAFALSANLTNED